MNMEKVKELISQTVKTETESLKKELVLLRTENNKLKEKVNQLEWALDEVEQYNRKSCLILGGDGVPEHKPNETSAETREIALGLIKEKLNVTLKGGTAACHRLRNKKRVIVKFQDADDRDAVYQAKFNQSGDKKITVHENLTDKRARMVKFLGDLRANGKVLNYHTKNGMIFARDSADKRYTRIQPWFTEQEIMQAMQDAHPKTEPQSSSHGRFLRSQTLESIPKSHVVNRTADFEELMIDGNTKRKSKRGGASANQNTEVGQ